MSAPHVELVHKVLADAPGSGATVTIYDSTANCGTGWHFSSYFGGLLLTMNSSHDSDATDGVTIENSHDGTTWYAGTDSQGVTFPRQYLTASGEVTYPVIVQRRHIRVKYKNSTNVLTRYLASVFGVKELLVS